MSIEFGEWLKEELQRRGWIDAELANRAGIASGNLSRVFSGERNPGADMCLKIARSLDLAPELVFRKAGLLPPLPATDEEMTAFMELARLLSPERRAEVKRYMRFLAGWEREERGK